MRLSNEDFVFLQNELIKTPIMGREELQSIKSSNPQIYYTTQNIKNDFVTLRTEKSYVYQLSNETLNKFICEKFDEPIEHLSIIHRLLYGTGGFAKKHKDRFTTYKTGIIIIKDTFTGGDMYINDMRVELNTSGDYVSFNGAKEEHEVKEITSGYRDILHIRFSKKQSKISLI
jgi:hypothetical protein